VASLSATESRKWLNALNDEVTSSHEPVQITGKRGNAVLRSESDWWAIQKILHLVSIPGTRESILDGLAVPVEDLRDLPGWWAGAFASHGKPRRTLMLLPPHRRP
jgi:antitoxin YefM